MSEKDGGPAFPAALAVGADGLFFSAEMGMTLRDWFAGQALAGCIAACNGDLPNDKVAAWAYKQADAMLKERAK